MNPRSLLIGLLLGCVIAPMSFSQEDSCKADDLVAASNGMHQRKAAVDATVKARCGPRPDGFDAQYVNCSMAVMNESPSISESEFENRLKTCADGGSAFAAGWYGQVLYAKAANLAAIEQETKNQNYPSDGSWISQLQKATKESVGPSRQKQAESALFYFEKSYSLDNLQAEAAEGAGDILANGYLGPNRRFEALNWYYKAGTAFMGWPTSIESRQQQAARVLEKMSAIDRQHVLTRRLESTMYPQSGK